MGQYFRDWLNEDVRYIITASERKAYEQLETDDERRAFIEQFWTRRDPTPDTVANELKIEHYRRIAFANEHYATNRPGWQTERGCMHIIWGIPDRVVRGSETETLGKKHEKWFFLYLEGIGAEVWIDFVDDTGTGEYRLIAGKPTTCLEFFNPGKEEPLGAWLPTRRKPPDKETVELRTLLISNLKHNEVELLLSTEVQRVTAASSLVSIKLRFPGTKLCAQDLGSTECAQFRFLAMFFSEKGRVAESIEEKIPGLTVGTVIENEDKGSNATQKFDVVLPSEPYEIRYLVKERKAGKLRTGRYRFVVP